MCRRLSMRSLAQHVYRSTIVFSAILLLLLVFGARVDAQGVNDFVINSFGADYDLSDEDPQGFMEITESINLTFAGQNRGILRAIPAEYKGNSLNLQIKSVTRDTKPEPYITYEENDNIVLRIGDADLYITGEHSYVIEYSVENVITFYDGYDELFWDVNGDQWLQPFTSVTADVDSTVRLSPDIRPACFTGGYGETAQNCDALQQTNSVQYSTTKTLLPGETLTFVQAFEKGYFTPMSWLEKYGKITAISGVIVGFQLLVVNSARKQWKQYGKDYKKRGAIPPYFGRPKKLSVMQASYVSANKLDSKHVSGSIIDLAIRGYIRIIEQGSGRSIKHQLELTKTPDSKLAKDEAVLLNALFSPAEVSTTIELEKQKSKLYSTMVQLKKQLDSAAAKKGYYELSPLAASKKLGLQLVLAFVGLVVGFFAVELTLGITVATGIVAFVSVLVFHSLMSKRSPEGNMLVEHMEGLKLYLDMAEKDRIEAQDAVEAPLAENAGQPKRDVKFYEKLLPFAVAMGVEKSWSEAFEDIYSKPPDWYNGNWKTFSTIALASSLSGTVAASGQAFSSPSSSGGSGSSGGGFSGGGGGGGGGGGW